MILIAVLGAIGILYILVLQMAQDVVFTSQYYQRVAFREKAYYISKSVYSGVVKLLSLDDESYDSLQDEWAIEHPPYFLKEDNVYVSVRIEDIERYFNPNTVMKKDVVDEKHLRQFKRLLKAVMLDPNLSNALLDWMDTDFERRTPLGYDGLDYGDDIKVKGGSLDSIEEFKFIHGFYPDGFYPKVVHGRKVPSLVSLLSIYTDGKVNINTAPYEILLSLDEDMSDDVVSEIIRRRSEKPFKKMEELLDLPGINHDLLFRIKQLSDVKSKHFKIIITVESKDGSLSSDLTAIIKRQGSSGQLLFWKAD